MKNQLPDFGREITRVNREDGCKLEFADGSWVIIRFSGTEPLLRLAAEGNTDHQPAGYIRVWKDFLDL